MLLFRSGIEKNPGPKNDIPGSVKAGIAAAFSAGSKKRGRPKSAGGESSEQPRPCQPNSENDEGSLLCECGKIFDRRRNFVQHQDRCPLLTKRAVTPECSKRRRAYPPAAPPPPAPPTPAPTTAQPPLTLPVTVYKQDDETVKLIKKCK